MLIEFSLKNFMSFKECVTISFVANTNKGFKNNYIEVSNYKLLKSSVIYGANASGKTNIIKGIYIMTSMLMNSNKLNVGNKLPFTSFKFDENTINEPSEYEVKYLIDGILHTYGFSADKDRIYEEYLYYSPNGRETKIFHRKNTNEYTYSKEDAKILKDIIPRNLENKLFLSTCANLNYKKVIPSFTYLVNSINVCSNINDLEGLAFKIYDEHPEIKEKALNFLKETDSNIEDYNIISKMVKTKSSNLISEVNIPSEIPFYNVTFKHVNSEVLLDYKEESLGTQIIFILLPFLIDTINGRKTILIDELDRSLHPHLLEYIVRMFNDESNTAGGQLIFNTHDSNLLNANIYRRDQIWFTEKDFNSGVSEIYSLQDFSIREYENFEKNYLNGKYGAVPFINNDLSLETETDGKEK